MKNGSHVPKKCFEKSFLNNYCSPLLRLHFSYLIIPTNVAEKVVIKLLHSGMWTIQWTP